MKREVYLKTLVPKLRKRWLGLLAAALCALPVAAQTAKPATADAVLSKLSCKAGDVVTVPIEMAVPGAVALQLDFEFDPARLALAETSGTTVEIAPGKQMSVYHLSRGRARLVVFGHDLAALPAGHLGDVRFRALTDTLETPIAAPRRTVSDASGHVMTTRVRGGVIVGSQEVGHE